MERIGELARGPGQIFLTGGATAVLFGWRDRTVDVDLKMLPEPAGVFEAIAKLKDELRINIELASPDLFIPELPGWRERSRHIATCGEVEFLHYDFYGQALAKIERGHARDLSDANAMVASGLVDRGRLGELFRAIKPELIRYPAIDPVAFRRKVEGFLAE
jgi:hypothetical protein